MTRPRSFMPVREMLNLYPRRLRNRLLWVSVRFEDVSDDDHIRPERLAEAEGEETQAA